MKWGKEPKWMDGCMYGTPKQTERFKEVLRLALSVSSMVLVED